jgi:hypothetical protein
MDIVAITPENRFAWIRFENEAGRLLKSSGVVYNLPDRAKEGNGRRKCGLNLAGKREVLQ